MELAAAIIAGLIGVMAVSVVVLVTMDRALAGDRGDERDELDPRGPLEHRLRRALPRLDRPPSRPRRALRHADERAAIRAAERAASLAAERAARRAARDAARRDAERLAALHECLGHCEEIGIWVERVEPLVDPPPDPPPPRIDGALQRLRYLTAVYGAEEERDLVADLAAETRAFNVCAQHYVRARREPAGPSRELEAVLGRTRGAVSATSRRLAVRLESALGSGVARH